MVGTAPRRVLDLGAGTGRLTEGLLADGHRVLAVDPSVPMLAHLAGRLATPAVAGGGAAAGARPGVRRRRGRAGLPLVRPRPGRAGDRAGAPARRRGGDGLEPARRDRAVGAPAQPRHRRRAARPARPRRRPRPVRLRAGRQQRFRIWQRLDRQGLLDLVSSRSYVAALGADERTRMLADVGELYDAHRGDPLGMQMPYETSASAPPAGETPLRCTHGRGRGGSGAGRSRRRRRVVVGWVWRRRHDLGTPADRATFATLHTASLASPALRAGLTAASAERAVRHLRTLLGVPAVALTDSTQVLAWDGGGTHHRDQVLALAAGAIEAGHSQVHGAGDVGCARPVRPAARWPPRCRSTTGWSARWSC